MKKTFKIILILLVLISVILINIKTITSKINEELALEKDKKYYDDYFVLTKYIKNKGILVGDLTSFSLELYNSGEIKGDILASTLYGEIDGLLRGDVRIIGGLINIDGEIRKNITAFTKEIKINDNSIVDGSLTVFTKKLKVYGHVGSGINGSVETLIINGEVKGDINIKAKEILFGPNGKVHGDIYYKSDKELLIPKEYVKGEIEYIKDNTLKKINIFILYKKLISYFCLIFIGILLNQIIPNEVQSLTHIIKEKKQYNFFFGAMFLIIIPIITILMMLTIIGIPISILLVLLYIIVTYIIKIPIGYLVGDYIIKKDDKNLKIITGILLLMIIHLIPYIGPVFNFIIISIGLGSLYYRMKFLIGN